MKTLVDLLELHDTGPNQSALFKVSLFQINIDSAMSNGPVTLLRIVLVYASIWKISIIHWYTPTYARGTLGIGCMCFKHGGIRWHTHGYGKAELEVRYSGRVRWHEGVPYN